MDEAEQKSAPCSSGLLQVFPPGQWRLVWSRGSRWFSSTPTSTSTPPVLLLVLVFTLVLVPVVPRVPVLLLVLVISPVPLIVLVLVPVLLLVLVLGCGPGSNVLHHLFQLRLRPRGGGDCRQRVLETAVECEDWNSPPEHQDGL